MASESELIEEIERLRATTQQYRDHEPIIWAGAMRLYGERIADVIGLRHATSAEEFSDRREFLDHLLTLRLLDHATFDRLNSLRRFGNQMLHENTRFSEQAVVDVWASFDHLGQSKFWARPGAAQSRNVESYSRDEIIRQLIEEYGPRFGEFLKRSAGPIASLAIAGFLLSGYNNYLNSEEYQEQQRREAEREVQRAMAWEQQKSTLLGWLPWALGALCLIVLITALS